MDSRIRFLGHYFILQLKRGFLYLPKMLLGIVALIVVVSGFLLATGQWMQGYTEKQKISLGISLPENGTAEQWMFSILENMDSIKENCILLEMEEEEALAKLKEGSIYGAIIIPEGFVNGIMTGTNLPADIYLPDSPLQKEYISLLTKAGALSLASAQAGIYAMSDFAYSHHLQGAIPKIQEDLNRSYIRFTLKRPDYFRHVSITNSNSLALSQQYAGAGFTLFLLLSLISMAKLLEGNKRALQTKLSLQGLTPPYIVAVQTAVTFILLSLIALAILLPFLLYSQKMSHWTVAYLSGIVGALSASFAIASLGVLVYTAARSQAAAMLFLFLISVAMLFASGGFLPSYLLPSAIAKVGSFLPTAAMLKSMLAGFSNDYSGMLPCITFGLLFLLLSMFLANAQYKSAKGAARL